jgi:hypothetical protein
MAMRLLRRAAAAVLLLVVAACGPATKEEIVAKARDITIRAELEKALGRPTDIAKLGLVERWTYKASNGEVLFLLVGDRVTLQAAGPSDDKK